MSMIGLRDVLFVTPASAGGGGGSGGGGEQQSVIPLISTATPYHLDDRNSVTAIHHHLWQQQQQQQQQQQMVPPPPFSSSYNSNPSPNLRKPTMMPLATMLESSTLPTGIIGGSGNVLLQSLSSSGTATCQDCGNQAKKDCTHRRCRTCCKSRGFDCSTHVKSTWVPAARRRESQLSGCNINIGSSGSISTSKKPRLASRNIVTGVTTAATTTSNTSNSNTTTSSTHHDESLPGQVSLPAVFKCVKVTSIDDGEGEYAYQAIVRIGGHIFKGFLYDQGLKDREESDLPNKNTTMPNLSELHLGGGSAAASGAHGTNYNLLDGGGAAVAFGNNSIN